MDASQYTDKCMKPRQYVMLQHMMHSPPLITMCLEEVVFSMGYDFASPHQ